MRKTASLPTLAAGLLSGLVVLAGTLPAAAETVPVQTGEKAQLTGGITPIGDADVFGFELFPGDRLTVKMKDAGPKRGLLSTLALLDPSGAELPVTIKKQTSRRAGLTFTATEAGRHVVRLTGDPAGGFNGADGHYVMTTKIKRAKQGKETFSDVAGGAFKVEVAVTTGSQVDVKLSTKKGGFDVDGLYGPDGAAEPGFVESLKLNGRRKATGKKFDVSGEFGVYELRGSYDQGSNVKAIVKVRRAGGTKKKRLTDDEPRVDPLIAPFPGRGIVGSRLTVSGFNLASNESGPDADVLPRFWLGGIEIDNSTIEHPFGQSFIFPVPEGLATGVSHDLEVRNPDGQGDVYRDAFFVVPPPSVAGLDIDEAGPAGGRRNRILGTDLRGVSVVLFDGRIVQPTLVLDNRVDVVAPAHAPGEVTVTVRDEHLQTSDSPQKLTYLDIGSNEIDSVSPAALQGVGGETVTVTGSDFTADSMLTLDGRDVGATLVDATTMTFVAAPNQGGNYELKVLDQYEQSDSEGVEIQAFTNDSATIIPAPLVDMGGSDSWRATSILRGDVTGDGIEDLVLLRPSAAFGDDANRSRIRILAGDGAGGYTDATSGIPAVMQTDDWRARGGVLALVDNDAHLDIVVITTDELDGGSRSGTRVLLNDGQGNFTDDTTDAMPASTTWGDRNQGVAILAVDVDRDMDVDLVITHSSSFEETVDVSPPPPPPDPDPENNPPPDPVFETRYYAGTRVLLNDGTGIFTRDDLALPAVDADTPQRFEGSTLAATDLDGDNYPDLFVTSDTAVEDPDNAGTFLRRGILLLNDGSGGYSDVSDARLPAVSGVDHLQGDLAQFVDYDADGDLDLLVSANTRLVSPASGAVSTATALRIYPVDSNGNFSRVSTGTLPAADGGDSSQCESFAVGDLTGDGRPDIYLVSSRAPNSGEHAGRVLVWVGSKFVRGSAGMPHPTVDDDGRGACTLMTDVDGDGDLDLVLSRDESSTGERDTRVFVNPRTP